MFDPTAQQVAIRDAARTSANLVVIAVAGSGKTSTLRLLGADRPTVPMLYVAYNKAIQLDAEGTFTKNVSCRTAHSLAWGGTVGRYGDRVRKARMGALPVKDVQQFLNLYRPFTYGVDDDGNALTLEGKELAELVARTIGRFITSADFTITGRHVQRPAGLPDEQIKRITDEVLGLADRVWDDLSAVRGKLTFNPDIYLKLWQLSKPRLTKYKVIFLDEAQDANRAMADVFERQTHAQLIAVGDPCQPTGTMVTVVTGQSRGGRWGYAPTETTQIPIEQIKAGDVVVSYNVGKSFLRRSGSVVLGISPRPYDGELIAVKTATGETTRYTPNHHCVVRIGQALAGKHVVYLMRRGGDYRVGTTQGVYTSQDNRMGAMIRADSEKADALWILSVHDTKEDAVYAETITSWKYGVPEIIFHAGNRSTLTQPQLDSAWSIIGDNRENAARALKAHGREIEHPFWSRGQERMMVRRSIVTSACNLIDGMSMLPLSGAMAADGKRISRNTWSEVVTTREPYQGLVWSMTVENDHTYVGDGVVTHNCQEIYGWRGAANAMARWDWQRLGLTKSFRFGPAIAEQANRWLDFLDAEMRVEGYDALDSRVLGPDQTLDVPDAVLCRTNIGVVDAALRELAAGRRVAVCGGIGEVLRLARAAINLKAGRRANHPDLAAFRTWDEFLHFVANDPDGEQFRVLVALVELYGPEEILSLGDRLTAKECDADVTISTGHKSKGREWDSVVIGADFAPRDADSEDDPKPAFTREAAMLAYVCTTRAKLVLDPGPLGDVPL